MNSGRIEQKKTLGGYRLLQENNNSLSFNLSQTCSTCNHNFLQIYQISNIIKLLFFISICIKSGPSVWKLLHVIHRSSRPSTVSLEFMLQDNTTQKHYATAPFMNQTLPYDASELSHWHDLMLTRSRQRI